MQEVHTFAELEQGGDFGAPASAPMRLAVLGDPVAHSASPPMHHAALQVCGIPATYGRLHIRPAELAPALKILPQRSFIGVNCTIPHKAAALALMDRADEHATRLGVVNTVKVEDGKLIGFNTDGTGFTRALREAFDVELRDLKVVLLGAGGGAGRALGMQCVMEGCPALVLVNRTAKKAQELAGELAPLHPKGGAVTFVAWEERLLQEQLRSADLLINCTSLGMQPGDASPLPSRIIPSHLLVYDTIYTSPTTSLMTAAGKVGARCANGLSMLLHQGALAFEIWFERPAPLAEMRAALSLACSRR